MARRSLFKHHRFPRNVILCAVRWYLRYPLSYQDVVDLLAERGVTVDRSTVYRWVQKFGPELTKLKNRHNIEIELQPHVVEMIDRHVSLRAGLLCDPSSLWLFPMRRKNRSMDPNILSSSIFRTIRKSTGLAINAHLFRHIAAKLMLEARPGEYEAVRRLLGHSQLSRTLNSYAGFEAGTATRLFADIIDQEKA